MIARLSSVALVLVVALAALVSGNRPDSSKCELVDKAKDWWYTMQNENFPTLAGFYHRTAIRYDNGVLSPITNGLPLSPDQFKCIRRRVDIRPVLKSVGSDWEHSFVGVQFDWYINDNEALPIYVSLQFDRATCLISVERYYFPTAHPGFQALMSTVAGECFSESVPDQVISETDVVKRCVDYFNRGDATRFVQCFDPNGVWRVNGVAVPRELFSPIYWRTQFRNVKFNVQVVSLSKKPLEHLVSAVFLFNYTSARVTNGPSYSFVDGVVFHFNDAGMIDRVDETVLTKATEPLDFLNGVTLTPVDPLAENLNWTVREAQNNYIDTRFHLGPASIVDASAGGFAFWNSPALKQNLCVDRVLLEDVKIIHPPRFNTTDGGRHLDFLTAFVKVPASASRAQLVRRSSPSLMYNAVTKTLSAREYNLGADFAAIDYAVHIIRGVSKSEAQLVAGFGDAVDDVTYFDSHDNVVFNKDGTVDYRDENLKEVRNKMCDIIDQLNA